MKPNRKRSIIFTIAMVLYLAVVGYLLFANFEKLSSVPKIFLGIPTDKIVHFGMFFPFPILAYLAYDKLTDTPLKALAALVSICAIGAIFAGLTEIGQSLLPYRYEDISDFRADCLAIVLAGILTFIIDVSKMRRAS
ncbi:MAG: VanZ family protein [Bacteroidales bacterium]|nr:VanZ family protein [Bacteroidales bacterium]